jgi:citrate synthase
MDTPDPTRLADAAEASHPKWDAPHPERLADAAHASARLGVSRASLYSYVSRGLVRSFASPRDPRERLYSLDDVEALIRRRVRLRRPTIAAATALDWGLPVLETALTRVENGRLFYRGEDAIRLAGRATLEEVAALLIPDLDPWAFASASARRPLPAPASPPAPFLDAAIQNLSRAETDRDGEIGRAVRAILDLVAAAAGATAGDNPIHARLAAAWGLDATGANAVRRALVLCADHELSSSAFAVRVAASTGAALKEAVIAGLATLSGPRHGGATNRVRELLETGDDPAGWRRLRARLEAGEAAVAFAHHLYPDGDPRAAALLGALPPASKTARRDRARIRAIGALVGQKPSLDVGLVALERALTLPRGAAFAIFAVGRTVGWLAHAVEQRGQGGLIRPRARYIAPPGGSTRP